MCGIFGYSTMPGGLSVAERAIFAASAGQDNDSRGGDSWGVYAVNGKPQLVKGLGKIKGGFAFPVLHDCDVFMGHTRKATTGAISWDNAHPFKMGSIVGAHNGFVSNHEELNKRYSRKFEVDSMHIFAHLSERKDMKELHGWGAIEWSNTRSPSKIRLCRLSGGQLSVYGVCRTSAEAKTEGVRQNTTIAVVWSSSDWHVKDALALAGLTDRSFEFIVETDRVFVVSAGHYGYDGDRRLAFGEDRRWDYGNRSHFCGEDNDYSTQGYWKNGTRIYPDRSTKTSSAGFSLGTVGRKTSRMGRFAVIEDDISTVYVDPEIVRDFFQEKGMVTVAPLTEDNPSDEAILPPADEAKEASEAILKELEDQAKAISEGLVN